MKYYAIMPEHKNWVRIMVAFIGAYMIYNSIREGRYLYIPIGAIVILASAFFKQYIVTDKGVDVATFLLGMRHHNYWEWKDVTSLHTDYEQAAPNVQIHFGRDVVTRTFVMTCEDTQEILKLAAEKNPDMFIEDMNEEKRAELAAKAVKYREKQAAEKAKKQEARRNNKKLKH